MHSKILTTIRVEAAKMREEIKENRKNNDTEKLKRLKTDLENKIQTDTKL